MQVYTQKDHEQTRESDTDSSHILWEKLIDALSQETNLYDQLLHQEKEKSRAIKEKNLNELHEVSKTQEAILSKRDILETERESLVHQISQMNSPLNSGHENKTAKKLKELFDMDMNVPAEFGGILKSTLQKLQEKVYELQMIVEANRTMIVDNYDFFQELVGRATKRNTNDMTYDPTPVSVKVKKETGQKINGRGSQNKGAYKGESPQPIFLNTNC